MRQSPSSADHETWLQLGSLGVWGVYSTEEIIAYRTAQINTHFRGINIGNQSILFLSRLLSAASPAASCYIRILDPEVKSRAKYFPSFPTFYSERSTGNPGARPVPEGQLTEIPVFCDFL